MTALFVFTFRVKATEPEIQIFHTLTVGENVATRLGRQETIQNLLIIRPWIFSLHAAPAPPLHLTLVH